MIKILFMITNNIKHYAKKRNFSFFLASVMLLFSNILISQTGMGIRTVVIDPGHGGKDPGAIGINKVQEKDVVLAVSLKLGELIKKSCPDVKVIYTRSTDDFIGLAERATVANKAKADLFISIHSNVAGSASAKGFEASPWYFINKLLSRPTSNVSVIAFFASFNSSSLFIYKT